MALRSGQTATRERVQLGQLLLSRKLIDEAQLGAALQTQQQQAASGVQPQRLGEILAGSGLVNQDVLLDSLAEQLGVGVYKSSSRPSPAAVQLIPREFAEQQLVLPVAVNGSDMTVAMVDPLNAELLGFISERTGKKIIPLIGSADTISRHIQQSFGSFGVLDSHVEEYETTVGPVTDSAQVQSELAVLSADAPVVQIVNILMTEGLRERASDIHIEPQADRLRIRFRVDGALRDMKDLPLQMAPAVVSRIKVMSELDIVEKHRSQDGQIAIQIEGRDLDIRVNTTETIWGEKAVLRLLDRSRSFTALEELGMDPELISRFRPMIQLPFGMICVAGPTGSGKTTTLYAALHELDKYERNITTIEDPVEYVIPNINQINVKASMGRSFAHGLRAVLRQDPDVVLIGEVRDEETADIATQAALTGHTVFCSVHSTDSIAAIHRFMDMGVKEYLLAPAMEVVVSQRLVRRICGHCAVEQVAPPEERIAYQQVTGFDREVFWYGQGCEVCHGSGYYDRVGIYEYLRIDDEMKELIARHGSQYELRQKAIDQGMVPLVQAAMAKVTNNETTVSEVLRTVYAG